MATTPTVARRGGARCGPDGRIGSMSESFRELVRARRRVGGLLLVSAIVLGAASSAVSGASAANRANSPAVASQGHQRDRVDALIRRAMRKLPLQAVIVQ